MTGYRSDLVPTADSAVGVLDSGLNLDLFPPDRVRPSADCPPPPKGPYHYQLTCFCGKELRLRAAERATKRCRCGARASRVDGRITLEAPEAA